MDAVQHRVFYLAAPVQSFLQDIRFALRSLRKQRGFTAIAIACLALGIGANTAIFSVVRTVLLGALPYREPDRLARMYETFSVQGHSGLLGSVSVPNLTDWVAQQREFEALAAYNLVTKNIIGGDEAERVSVAAVTANTFDLLGVRAATGRTFTAKEDAPGALPVAVLSSAMWKRRYGARADAVGSTITLDSTTYTVVGVMPEGFEFPISTSPVELWVPFVKESDPDSPNRGAHYLAVIGRLRPGRTLAQAASDMQAIGARLATAWPGEQQGRSIGVVGLRDAVVGSTRTALFVLMGAVGLVLLIACANVANLLLARASGRRREVAIRTALGADAHRLVRQFLTESALLAVAGGTLGVAIAYAALRLVLGLAAGAMPRSGAIGIDEGVLAFTLVISLATGVAFGLVPALRAARPDLRRDLSESSGKTSIGAGRHRLLKGLVVAELALSMVLLAGAGLLIRSFDALVHVDPGMQTHNVLTMGTRVVLGAYPDSTPYARYYQQELERIRALPGVRAAGIASYLPVQHWGMNGGMQIEGRPKETDPARAPFAEFRTVSTGYFKALGIPIRAGREFNDGDQQNSLPVVIINQEFARRYFPNEDPVGHELRAWSPTPYKIIGVAGSVRQAGLDQDPRSEVYVNAAQNPQRLGQVSFVISTSGSPTALVAPVRASVRAVSASQPIFAVETMEQVINESLGSRKLTLVLLGVLATLALVLAAAGIYGVMAYLVTQRTRELGVRMALGATARTVAAMVLRDAGVLAATGMAIGLAASLALSTLMQSLLYGIGARDLPTLAVACVLLPTIALVASFVPARRAARTDPLVAMRAE